MMDNNAKMNRHLPKSADEQNSTKIGTASSSADPTLGFKTTNRHMRSVLMHPIGLPLVIYLNDVPSGSYSDRHLAYIREALNSYQNLFGDNMNNRNHVFAATVLDWRDGTETDLTSKLKTNMQILNLGTPHVTPYGEECVGIKGDLGRTDFLFTVAKQDGSEAVGAIFEFGIAHKNWWKKQDQLLKYVKILQDNPKKTVKFDGPILLSVITVNKGGGHLTLPKHRTLQARINWSIANEQNKEGVTFAARFGVFLCTPKGGKDFRIALLWRRDANTLQDASMQFGKVLYAVHFCSYLSEYCKENQEKILYEYLGPNCCKFGDSVRLIRCESHLFRGLFRHETMLTF